MQDALTAKLYCALHLERQRHALGALCALLGGAGSVEDARPTQAAVIAIACRALRCVSALQWLSGQHAVGRTPHGGRKAGDAGEGHGGGDAGG